MLLAAEFYFFRLSYMPESFVSIHSLYQCVKTESQTTSKLSDLRPKDCMSAHMFSQQIGPSDAG